MRCLYIVEEDPLSPNYFGGASAMYYDQLLALSDLGHDVHLWHFASPNGRERFKKFIATQPHVWHDVTQRCKSVWLSEHGSNKTVQDRLWGRLRSLFSPGLPVLRRSLWSEFGRMLKRTRPEFIWAQHFGPGALTVQQKGIPVVYVHHDWLYRIKALRGHRDINRGKKRLEERVVRSAAAVVSGSHLECSEISALGCKSVHYIPVTYEPVCLHENGELRTSPRLIHFGGLATTANREGLLAFMEQVWPHIEGLEFWVIGNTADAPPALRARLTKVKCTGFVQNLEDVLRPFDIHIIPWRHSTGQRTRVPVAFNYAQVVVATRASVACYPEAVSGENCLLVNNLGEMASAIHSLSRSPDLRVRLGKNARATFESCFTRPGVLSRYRAVVEALSTNAPKS